MSVDTTEDSCSQRGASHPKRTLLGPKAALWKPFRKHVRPGTFCMVLVRFERRHNRRLAVEVAEVAQPPQPAVHIGLVLDQQPYHGDVAYADCT